MLRIRRHVCIYSIEGEEKEAHIANFNMSGFKHDGGCVNELIGKDIELEGQVELMDMIDWLSFFMYRDEDFMLEGHIEMFRCGILLRDWIPSRMN